MKEQHSRSRFLRQLGSLPLRRVVAHGGEGEIDFCRAFESCDFVGPWNFVDYAVLPPGTSIGLHRHGDDEELYLILSGKGTVTRDGQEFAVGPGSVVVNRPNGLHGMRNDGTEPLHLFVVDIDIARRKELP